MPVHYRWGFEVAAWTEEATGDLPDSLAPTLTLFAHGLKRPDDWEGKRDNRLISIRYDSKPRMTRFDTHAHHAAVEPRWMVQVHKEEWRLLATYDDGWKTSRGNPRAEETPRATAQDAFNHTLKQLADIIPAAEFIKVQEAARAVMERPFVAAARHFEQQAKQGTKGRP
jgi:hypothetical protein